MQQGGWELRRLVLCTGYEVGKGRLQLGRGGYDIQFAA